jgi:hypothetical protein
VIDLVADGFGEPSYLSFWTIGWVWRCLGFGL